jgi:type VI secretion system protein VasG
VFDRGAMRDGEDREIDFRNCVILMTSNLGSAPIDAEVAQDPNVSQAQLLDAIHSELVDHFQPALLARFQTLAYRPLDVAALAAIVRMKLAKVAERLQSRHGIALDCDEALVDTLAQVCAASESGARNVDAYLNQQILPALSRELLSRMGAADDATPMPAVIRLSQSGEGRLSIDFIDADGSGNGNGNGADAPQPQSAAVAS